MATEYVYVESPIKLQPVQKGIAIGPPGKSAYQMAVQNGFQGTLEQWLESLRGQQGRDGDSEMDGGSADSVYLESQVFDCGNSNEQY